MPAPGVAQIKLRCRLFVLVVDNCVMYLPAPSVARDLTRLPGAVSRPSSQGCRPQTAITGYDRVDLLGVLIRGRRIGGEAFRKA